MSINIQPFGTSTDSPTHPLAPIKLFGCTVVDFNVSADWSSQGGSLSCRLIESETDGDKLTLPVLGSPVSFEVKNTDQQIIFQYVGIVDSFSRSSNNSKTYSVTISSPMKILESTNIILDGYLGLGASTEGSPKFTGIAPQDYGHNNSYIYVDNLPGRYHWWNVSNLINVYGILENDDPLYRIPSEFNLVGLPSQYGDFGFSGKSQDGIPLLKLMWALHIGINHLPPLFEVQSYSLDLTPQRQKVLGGNLLFGRHNYNLYDDKEALPYYYHFDAVHLYRQIYQKLGPEYRVAGQYKTLSEIITELCAEANLEFFTYLDIYNDPTIGDPTLQDQVIYPEVINKTARLNWIPGVGQSISPLKFTQGGNYGGTIRIKTIDKNAFFNPNRPFSNIAYNLIGLEVPDLRDTFLSHNVPEHPNRNGQGWVTNDKYGIHPGVRPIRNTQYGLSPSGSTTYNIYSDPLDASGIAQWRGNNVEIQNENWGFTKGGTMSVASGGSFPVEATGSLGASVLFDPLKRDSDLFPRIKNSDISIKLNDFTTMKVITGGYQTRLVATPRPMLRHYWGDILLSVPSNPRENDNTETDSLGLNENSTRKIPVVTPLLDPRDVDDYILIDMKSEFGPISIGGVLSSGIYAASLLEIRCAMASFESWKAFMEGYKYDKIRNLTKTFYPNCTSEQGRNVNGQAVTKDDLTKSTQRVKANGGVGYAGLVEYLGLGNLYTANITDNSLVSINNSNIGEPEKAPAGTGPGLFGLGIDIKCTAAELNVKQYLLPPMHEKIKEIGDTHYGKSWYAPVPYAKSMQDLDGNNLVGNFKRSWEINDSAYVEPSDYYRKQIPQSNLFIQDGKVSPFLNYDNNFVSTNTGEYDTSYQQDLTNLVGQNQKVCNFSEYTLDKLCMTKYYIPSGIDSNGNIIYNSGSGVDIIHAAPENVEDRYAFLPLTYDDYYNRAKLPFSDILTGLSKRYVNTKNQGNREIPESEGQAGTTHSISASQFLGGGTIPIGSFSSNTTPKTKTALPGAEPGQVADEDGYFQVSGIIGIPSCTNTAWLNSVVSGLSSLKYEDNGRFCFPYVKFTSSRVFPPVSKPGMSGGKAMNDIPLDGMNAFLGTAVQAKNGNPNTPGSRPVRQHLVTEDQVVSVLKPFQSCIAPYSFNYAQISTRYVYGPWMTSLAYIPFRGKIEYEQDESLVPENFLIPTNFGIFGGYTLSQTSGFAGMDLAAQGRANAIDDFALFVVEEGSITLPGAPAIKRIGDTLYGIQQVTDIKISVNNQGMETTYTFKTITPKFGKNNRDLEKKLTKISNDIKKLKLT